MKICRVCEKRRAEYHRTLCRKCRTESRKEYETWQHLKSNAARRGKEFTITFEQFKHFCYKTSYIQGKGRTKECYSIDRIDSAKGYTIDNIQVLSVSDNARKKNKKVIYEPGLNVFTVVDITPPPPSENYF